MIDSVSQIQRTMVDNICNQFSPTSLIQGQTWVVFSQGPFELLIVSPLSSQRFWGSFASLVTVVTFCSCFHLQLSQSEAAIFTAVWDSWCCCDGLKSCGISAFASVLPQQCLSPAFVTLCLQSQEANASSCDSSILLIDATWYDL